MKAGWTTVALGDVASIDRSTVKPTGLDPSTLYVGLEHIDKGGAGIHPTTVGAADARSTKFRFDSRHVLFGKLRPNLAKVALAPGAGVASTDILPILPGERLDGRFLRYFLLQTEVTTRLSGLASGANLPRLSPSSLVCQSLPLPPLDEQRRIASALEKVDALRTIRRESTRLLDAMPRALFEELFVRGGKASWPRMTVGEVASPAKSPIRTGPFGSQLLKEEFVDSGIPVLGIDNVVTNTFRWSDRRFIKPAKYRELERYTVHPGDVLITIMGTVGRCAIVPEDIPTAINTKHLCCITLDQSRCLPEFLRASFLWHPDSLHYLNATKKGAIMAGLNMGIIKSLPLALPSIQLQQEFARRLHAVESLRSRAEGHLAELDALFTSLQTRAFAGELDVSNVRIPAS